MFLIDVLYTVYISITLLGDVYCYLVGNIFPLHIYIIYDFQAPDNYGYHLLCHFRLRLDLYASIFTRLYPIFFYFSLNHLFCDNQIPILI